MRTCRKRAATLCHVGRHEFDPAALKVVPEWPLVYWWDETIREKYQQSGIIADKHPARFGMNTGNNSRFTRDHWEVASVRLWKARHSESAQAPTPQARWVPFVMGAKGRIWFEDLRQVVRWQTSGLELHVFEEISVGCALRNVKWYFRPGVAFGMIGSTSQARVHRFASVIDSKGSSIYPDDTPALVVGMNSKFSTRVLESLNPSISFQVGDVNRLPIVRIDGCQEVMACLESAFTIHESHREPSVEYKHPGPSPWRHAQDWAQLSVDRSEGAPLPPYEPELDPEPPTDHLSFAFGVALGRFGANGEGILDPTKDDLSATLPAGICFLDGSFEKSATGDSLGHSAAQLLHAKWAKYGPAVDPNTDLRTWLRLKFFGDVHKGMYENRPIYFPLSSEKKTFVAHVSIHRWTEDTLRALLAEHLHPALTRLEGEIADLRESRQSADKKIARNAERRYDQVAKWKQELDDFIAQVERCAEKGPPPPDAKTPEREIDARYAPDLDDGVMINSAALWPLLEPQWKDPKKWWKELASAPDQTGNKKDYDWAHLAARYFPSRVDKKCQEDPSLGVAHGCFWKCHPENAYKWELRLQDEIAPDFTIDEEGSDATRKAFEEAHPDKVEALVEAERKRREKKKKKQEKESGSPGPLFDAVEKRAAQGGAD